MRNQTIRHWPNDYLRSRDGVTLIPLARENATPSIVVEAYKRTKEDRLLKWVFSDEFMEFPEFFAYFTSGETFPVLAFLDDRFAGYAWLNDVSGKRAFCHCCFFREAWGKTELIANRILDYWFAMPANDVTYLFETIVGLTPTDNRMACKFIERIGFKVLGVIPHMDQDKSCLISYKTRGMQNGKVEP